MEELITLLQTILAFFYNIKTSNLIKCLAQVNKCTVVGYLQWRSPGGTMLLVKCFYSTKAPDTVIAPSNIVLNHLTDYHLWTQHADITKNWIHQVSKQYNKTIYQVPPHHAKWAMVSYCGRLHDHHSEHHLDDNALGKPIINRVSQKASFELMHARMGHHGTEVMSTIHCHVDGMPKIFTPPFHRCRTCMLVKATKRAITQKEITQITTTMISKYDIDHSMDNRHDLTLIEQKDIHCQPGERFHMDMGFVRGTKYSSKDEDGTTVTSLDGYNSCTLIIHRATRYIWIFLSRHKTPRIDIIKSFLQIHGAKTTSQKFVQTDEGGELWSSHEFQKAIKDAGYILGPTASDASFQNGLVE